jgi:hypothetical protein
MDEREGVVDAGVVGVSGAERKVFMLRDEELVEESPPQERSGQGSRNRGQDVDNRVLDVSPTPGRENWKLRENKSTTGESGGGVEERRGMSMRDIWPKDWGGKYLCSYVYCWLSGKCDERNGVFWDVTPCGSCMNQRFGGT